MPSFDNLLKDMKGSHLDPTKDTDGLLLIIIIIVFSSARVDLVK